MQGSFSIQTVLVNFLIQVYDMFTEEDDTMPIPCAKTKNYIFRKAELLEDLSILCLFV